MPLLGIISSAISGGLTGTFNSIATSVVGSGGESSITFSSIPSTFTHLQARYMTRDNRSGQSVGGLALKFNGDSSSIYANHRIQSDGTNSSASGGSGLGSSIFGIAPATTNTASLFGIGVIDILDYANTSKNKTHRTISGFDANGVSIGFVGLYSGLYVSTSAITSITFVSADGSGFLQHTHFALYGIKGA